jgi:hemerythrin-like domain-containing protein
MPSPATPRIIREEHRALGAVLRTLMMVVRDARYGRSEPPFRAMRAMLLYIDEFPERLHHVKESGMLFPRLRECTGEADAVLARLDSDHRGGQASVRQLQHKLAAWEFLGDTRRHDFETALESHTAFYLEHMRIEEAEVLPLAERCFCDADWLILDRAFGAHRDALTGSQPDAPYVELFRTIVSITPAPFGVGATEPTTKSSRS